MNPKYNTNYGNFQFSQQTPNSSNYNSLPSQYPTSKYYKANNSGHTS